MFARTGLFKSTHAPYVWRGMHKYTKQIMKCKVMIIIIISNNILELLIHRIAKTTPVVRLTVM